MIIEQLGGKVTYRKKNLNSTKLLMLENVFKVRTVVLWILENKCKVSENMMLGNRSWNVMLQIQEWE